jgi:hypothetical protein
VRDRHLAVGIACCIASASACAASADLPLADLIDAWHGRAVLIEYDSASKAVTGNWGVCFDFRDFDDCTASVLDLGRHPKKIRAGRHCSIQGGIAQDVPVVPDGAFSLTIMAIGLTVQDSFIERPRSSAQRFMSQSNRVYTVQAGGSCPVE